METCNLHAQNNGRTLITNQKLGHSVLVHWFTGRLAYIYTVNHKNVAFYF